MTLQSIVSPAARDIHGAASHELVKTAPDGSDITTELIRNLREANRQRLSGLRGQMLETQVRLANLLLRGSKKDLDCVERLRAEIAVGEDAGRALELAEILATLRDLEIEQKQLDVERQRLAGQRDELQSGYDVMNRPSFTVERVERLREIESAIHEVGSAIGNIDQRSQSAGARSLEYAAQLESFAVHDPA